MKLATLIPIPVTIRNRGRFTGRTEVFNCPRELYVAARRTARILGKPWNLVLADAIKKAVYMEGAK